MGIEEFARIITSKERRYILRGKFTDEMKTLLKKIELARQGKY